MRVVFLLCPGCPVHCLRVSSQRENRRVFAAAHDDRLSSDTGYSDKYFLQKILN
mgnify:FL=1